MLRDRGTITSQQYEEAVKERQAAGAVELALNPEWTRKKAVLAELKQTLEREHQASQPADRARAEEVSSPRRLFGGSPQAHQQLERVGAGQL